MNHTITPIQIRRIILEQSFRAHVGHIGSALSIADIIAALYGNVLKISSPEDAERDRFILSKGHAALALYAALFLKGWLPKKQLDTYCTPGSLLGVHPECMLRGIDFATGSLGQGISMATGSALAARMLGSRRRVFVVVSDGECNEGSLWEAIMFGAHQRLGNLTVIVDLNQQQALGYTRDVMNLDPLEDRLRSFGWDTISVDGNDANKLSDCMNQLDYAGDRPHAVVAHTVFGKGVSFMENQIKWHYLPVSEEQYKLALKEIENISL